MRCLGCMFRDLWCRLRGRDTGWVFLSAGRHEISIKTWCTPEKVFLTVTEPAGCFPVCLANVSMVGTKIIDDGFVMYANIESSAAIVEWTVRY